MQKLKQKFEHEVDHLEEKLRGLDPIRETCFLILFFPAFPPPSISTIALS
jgi:hypothetical protein